MKVNDIVCIGDNLPHCGEIGKLIEIDTVRTFPYSVQFAGGDVMYYLEEHLEPYSANVYEFNKGDWCIQYQPGKSKFDGKLMDNFEIAKEFLSRISYD